MFGADGNEMLVRRARREIAGIALGCGPFAEKTSWLFHPLRVTQAKISNITMKYDFRKLYIGGEWALPSSPADYQVINPATEEVVGVISLGSTDDAARAVAAAKAAFPEYGRRRQRSVRR